MMRIAFKACEASKANIISNVISEDPASSHVMKILCLVLAGSRFLKDGLKISDTFVPPMAETRLRVQDEMFVNIKYTSAITL